MDLASSLTVIGWFVQVLLDQGITFAIGHWGGAGAGPDLPAALERLRVVINNVRAVLPIAKKMRSENEGLLEYVKDLKDAAYDAEDILSDLDYYRLQKEVEGNDNSSSGGSSEVVEGNDNSSSGYSMLEAAGCFLLPRYGFARNDEDSQATTSPPSPYEDSQASTSPHSSTSPPSPYEGSQVEGNDNSSSSIFMVEAASDFLADRFRDCFGPVSGLI